VSHFNGFPGNPLKRAIVPLANLAEDKVLVRLARQIFAAVISFD
jgi:hypothetical protein